jgi:hypothetical protein
VLLLLLCCFSAAAAAAAAAAARTVMSAHRYAVVYRLLHQVLVVVVSRAHSNVFSSLNLAAAISRLLVAEAKSIELTPERLLKKYAQVCKDRLHLACTASQQRQQAAGLALCMCMRQTVVMQMLLLAACC